MHITTQDKILNKMPFLKITTLGLTTHSTTQKLRTLPSPPVPVRPVEGYS